MAQTTTGASHKNTQHAKVPTGTTGHYEKATCTAEGIEAFCEHTKAKEKAAPPSGAGTHAAHAQSAHTNPAHPATPAKPATPEDGRRFAEEEADPPPPASPQPGQPAPVPPKPGAKSLVLQLVPTAAEDDEDKGASVKTSGVKGLPDTTRKRNSSEVGLVKHVAGTGKGDQVTILAKKAGTASPCPKWIITDHGTGQGAAKKEEKSGTPLKYTFLPPDAAELRKYIISNPFFKVGWLDVVKPRHYTVVCTSPFPAQPAHQPPSGHPQAPANHSQAGHPRPAASARHPQAPAAHPAPPQPPGEHHTLEVDVYPSDKWTVKLITEESAHMPRWEEILEKGKKEIESLVDHLTELASAGNPAIPNVKIKLMEGELSLSNFWEEEEGGNLVHWTAELEGKFTFIDLTLKFRVDPNKFLAAAKSFGRVAKAAEKAAEKFADFMKREAGISGEASLYIDGQVKVVVKGKGSWEKEEKGTLTAKLEGLSVELMAGAGVNGEIEIDRMKDGKKEILVKFEGTGNTEVTLAISPRLGPSANFLLDNKYTWDPFKVTLTAQVNPKNDKGKTAPPGEATQAIPGAGEWEWNWSGDLVPEVKDKPLPSFNFTKRQWEPAPTGEQKPLIVKRIPLPPLKPSSTPPLKPVPVPQTKD